MTGDPGWRVDALRAEVAMLRDHVTRNTERGRQRRRQVARQRHRERAEPGQTWFQAGRRDGLRGASALADTMLADAREPWEIAAAVASMADFAAELECDESSWPLFAGSGRRDNGATAPRLLSAREAAVKYVHRPTVVEAQRYDGPGSLSPDFEAAICVPPCPLGGTRYRNDEPLPHIDTGRGPALLEVGMWVLRELDGEGYYPVRPSVFEASYQPWERAAVPDGGAS